MQKIQNIIFDLGGVLLNIDFKLSEMAFERLGIENFNAFFNQFHSNDLFIKLETGMDPDLFYEEFRAATRSTLSNNQIKDAWNALLLNFREESIKTLPVLRKKYKLFVLSNTNEIHLQEFQKRFAIEMQLSSFDNMFDAAYYSHRIGFRKPNADAFQFVLQKQQLIPNETLFIDDSINNIETAQHLGLQTIHLLPHMKIEALDL